MNLPAKIVMVAAVAVVTATLVVVVRLLVALWHLARARADGRVLDQRLAALGLNEDPNQQPPHGRQS